jgi:hypothetical protein
MLSEMIEKYQEKVKSRHLLQSLGKIDDKMRRLESDVRLMNLEVK